MADMNCLNNEDELVSQLDSQSQIDSELDSEAEIAGDIENVVEISKLYTGVATEDVVVSVDNTKNTISAELTDGVKNKIGQNIADIKENKQAIQQLSSAKADKKDIPTKVSQLENDNNYATKEYVNTNGGKIDKILVNGTEQTITNKAVDIFVPVKLSELTNDKGFIDNTVNNLVNYYTKSETYTKSEVLDLMAQIPKFSVQIVSTLPTENISTTTIYLVAVADVDSNNYFEEFLYADGKWELIGTTKIDLTGYYTKEEVDKAIQTAVENIEIPEPVTYSAGEGLSLDDANTFSVNPAQQELFGSVKIWINENNFLCISTKRATETISQELSNLTITNTGSEITQTSSKLIIGG